MRLVLLCLVIVYALLGQRIGPLTAEQAKGDKGGDITDETAGPAHAPTSGAGRSAPLFSAPPFEEPRREEKQSERLYYRSARKLPPAAAAKVNVNTADEETLLSLEGIGEAKAKAIIDYRQKNGPFKTVDDLMKVKGIGAKQLGKIKEQISVEQ